MDNVVQNNNVEDNKLEWMKRNNNEVKTEVEVIGTEQEEIVQKLKKMLDLFDKVKVTNEDCLVTINKSLDELLSSLKYLPVEGGTCFGDLPPELKTDILNYSCDSGTLVLATVCQDWKNILEHKLAKLSDVNIGMCCWTDDGPGCENSRDRCFKPEEVLKASRDLKLDICLEICYPVTNVDSNLLAEGLMSVPSFSIDGHCYCREDDEIDEAPMMTEIQIKDLFEAMEKATDKSCVELRGIDMNHLDQDKLMDCLLRTKELMLSDTRSDWRDPSGVKYPILDVEKFIEKLLQESNFNLSNLYLEYLTYPMNLSVDLANALCKVKVVHIGDYFPFSFAALRQLIKNVLRGCIAMESLCLEPDFVWSSRRITPEDLKTFISKLKQVELSGGFSQEQLEAVRSLPGVQVTEAKVQYHAFTSFDISKGDFFCNCETKCSK